MVGHGRFDWLLDPAVQAAILDTDRANLHDPSATNVYSCAGPGQLVIEAISHGLSLPITAPKDYAVNKVSIIWGILRGSGVILRSASKHKQDYWFVDHGYFLRGHQGYGDGPGRHAREQFYRIVKNGMQHTKVLPRKPDRWESLCKLGGAEWLRLDPWQTTGTHIVLTPPSPFFLDFFDLKHWKEKTIEEIKKHTDREIVVREKPPELMNQDHAERPLAEDLKNAWALVTWRSNTAVEAVCQGIPVFTDAECGAAPMGLQDLSQIESPVYPDREPWCWSLSYNQYSRKELLSGAWYDISQQMV